MADHLFGDLFEEKPATPAAPGESHLFGDMFPDEAPKRKSGERGADVAKIAKLILLGSPARYAADKDYRAEVDAEFKPLFEKYRWDSPAPFTEKPIFPEIARSIGRGVTAPGRAAQGGYRVRPEVRGQWSEIDEFRQQQAEKQASEDTNALASVAITGGIPAVTRAGASSIPMLNAGTSRETAELARTAMNKYGYPVRPGQMSDNTMVRRIDSILERMPFSGYKKSGQAQQRAINRGIAREVGVDADKINSTVWSEARDRLKSIYESIYTNDVQAPLDGRFIGGIRGILTRAEDALGSEKMRSLNKAVGGILEKVKGEGTIGGKAYQGLREENSLLKDLMGEPGLMGNYARQVRSELDSLFRRAIPEEKQTALAEADRQYAIMKQLRPLVAKAEDHGGDVSPQLLAGAIRKGDAGLERAAFGNDGNLGELASIGQAFKPMSTSGTAENEQVFNLLTGLLANPFTLGAGGAGVGAMLGGLPAVMGGAALGAGGTRALGGFMASPSRAENMILRALGERGAIGQELPNVGAVPFLQLEPPSESRRLYMDMSQ